MRVLHGARGSRLPTVDRWGRTALTLHGVLWFVACLTLAWGYAAIALMGGVSQLLHTASAVTLATESLGHDGPELVQTAQLPAPLLVSLTLEQMDKVVGDGPEQDEGQYGGLPKDLGGQ